MNGPIKPFSSLNISLACFPPISQVFGAGHHGGRGDVGAVYVGSGEVSCAAFSIL